MTKMDENLNILVKERQPKKINLKNKEPSGI